jgi:hypothetical protein
MLITLKDGMQNVSYDTLSGSVQACPLAEHAMRYHIVEKRLSGWTAREHIGTTDNVLIDKIMGTMYSRFGRLDADNQWIRPRLSRKEFWPADDYRRIVQEDLSRIFGNNVVVTGTSLRYIYYTSDDRRLSKSPDNIGVKFGYPLIYQGYAVASIFKINSRDVLAPGNNVVYWLTGPMWKGFHSKKRRVPKAFPGTTGFVASNWCQRTGYATYGQDGIDIAAMTQGKSVAVWALNDLRDYWIQRQGSDIFKNIGDTFPAEVYNKEKKSGSNNKLFTINMLKAKEKAPFGIVGLVCPKCGYMLTHGPYTHCPACGFKDQYGNLVSNTKHKNSYCVHCGRFSEYCNVAVEKMGYHDHKAQHNVLYDIWYKNAEGL